MQGKCDGQELIEIAPHQLTSVCGAKRMHKQNIKVHKYCEQINRSDSLSQLQTGRIRQFPTFVNVVCRNRYFCSRCADKSEDSLVSWVTRFCMPSFLLFPPVQFIRLLQGELLLFHLSVLQVIVLGSDADCCHVQDIPVC